MTVECSYWEGDHRWIEVVRFLCAWNEETRLYLACICGKEIIADEQGTIDSSLTTSAFPDAKVKSVLSRLTADSEGVGT